MASGAAVQSSVVYTESRQSNVSPIVTVKSSSSSMSKPDTGQPQIDGGSPDVGTNKDLCISSGFVKVQAPTSHKACTEDVSSHVKSDSSSTLCASEQGRDDDCSDIFVQNIIYSLILFYLAKVIFVFVLFSFCK